MAKRKVAIFDIDGTVFRSSLTVELVEALVREGAFPARAKKMYEEAEKKWLDREGDYDGYVMAVVKAFMAELKGVDFEDFSRIGKSVIAEQKKHVYVYTRDLIQKLKKKNYYLVAISQSPKIILDEFCKHLGFNKVYGRVYPIGPLGKFTGEVADEHLIANKVNIVRRVIDREGLTIKDSYVVGDTEGDISMLELAENPICFNPNLKLYKYAKRMGWKIVVERKNVVYEL